MCIKGKLNIKSPDSFSWEVVQRLPALPWRTRMRAASHSRGNHQRKGHFVKNVIFAVLRVRRGIFSPRSLELFHFKMKHCHMFLPPGRAPLWVYQIPTYIHNASGLHWEKHSKIIRPVMNARPFSCTRAAVCDPCLYLNPPDMKKNPVISGRCYRERLIVANCSKYQSVIKSFLSVSCKRVKCRVVDMLIVSHSLKKTAIPESRLIGFEQWKNPLPNNAQRALLTSYHLVCQHIHLCQVWRWQATFSLLFYWGNFLETHHLSHAELHCPAFYSGFLYFFCYLLMM